MLLGFHRRSTSHRHKNPHRQLDCRRRDVQSRLSNPPPNEPFVQIACCVITHVRFAPKADKKQIVWLSSRRPGSSATAACRCRAQRAPASGLFPGVSPEPVEDVGEVVAGPAFGDLVADDMIDMYSFGVNLE